MMWRRCLLPPDVFFRHRVVARALQKGLPLSGRTLLDVGGGLGEMEKFVAGVRVVTCDVDAGEVHGSGMGLPFQDRAFDAVVSVDTLEHVPPSARLAFVDELVRVARGRVVVVAPFASAAHERYEEELVGRYQVTGRAVPKFLEEHRRYGLVDGVFLDAVRRRFPTAVIRLVGLVGFDRVNFAAHLYELRWGKLNRVLYFLKFGYNLLVNGLVAPAVARVGAASRASRVVVVIDR